MQKGSITVLTQKGSEIRVYLILFRVLTRGRKERRKEIRKPKIFGVNINFGFCAKR